MIISLLKFVILSFNLRFIYLVYTIHICFCNDVFLSLVPKKFGVHTNIKLKNITFDSWLLIKIARSRLTRDLCIIQI